MDPCSATGDEEAIKSSSRLSAQIYANIVLRKMGVGYAVFPYLTNKFKSALCQTDLDSIWEDKAELLTWALFQGGAVATEESMRKWHVSQLVSFFRHLGVETWNDAFGLLENFLWVSPELERYCKPLWYEIAIVLSDFETTE